MKNRLIVLSLITAKALLAESLPVITVDESQDSSSTQISAQKIDRTTIENSVTGNGFISSLLKTNPNVTVVDSSENSETGGEIKPGKISINNAPYYQNNFLIDGISNNSLIDPNISDVFGRYDVPGNENEVFVDLDLIDSIIVYDSGISAEYGSFTGGVIDAKTIRPGAELSYKLSYKYTSDRFTEFHTSKTNKFANAVNDDYQPNFEKNFYNFYITTPINDSNGIIFSYDRKKSIIPGKYFDTFRDKQRLNESYFLKGSHYFEDDSVLDISVNYSPYESTHFKQYVKNSDTKIEGGGYSLKANYEKDFSFWNLQTNLAFKGSENTRKSLDYYKSWLKSNTVNWGIDNNGTGNTYSNEGGYGNVEKTQQSVTYNLKLKSEEFKLFDISNILKTGFELSFDKGEYNRKSNYYKYEDATLNYLVSCNGDSVGCIQNQQYFQKRKVYQAENTEVDMLSTAAYFEDKLETKYLEFTPGLRVDYNNYLENLDFAYRMNGSIKPFGDSKTVLYGGANRYYGKSFLGFKLREARLPYYEEYRSTSGNILQSWGTSADKDSDKYVFSDLETPYTDEALVGFKQDFLGMRLNLKYVKREDKNQFSTSRGNYEVYTMPNGVTQAYYKPLSVTNGGYTESDIVSLTFSSIDPISLPGFNLGYSLTASWNKKETNVDNYDDILNDDEDDDSGKIYYNGAYYDKNSLNMSSDPKNISLHLNMAFDSVKIFGVPCQINLNNIIKYKFPYTNIENLDSNNKMIYKDYLPNGQTKEYEVKVYEDVDYEKAITLDLKASFDFKVTGKHHLLVSTEVLNVFDEVQNIDSEVDKYKNGRQFWFNLAYKF